MTSRRTSAGDRRKSGRFEPTQDLWGTLEVSERWSVRDVAEGGVGVEVRGPMRTGSVVAVKLGPSPVHARIVHASEVEETSLRKSYRLGLEFLDSPIRRSDTDTR
jgi:hypothetical protein